MEILESKDNKIEELETEAERNRLIIDDIQRKLSETQILVEAAEKASAVRMLQRSAIFR